jgi:MmyB-like transcription regulator ligand binding domain
MSGFCGQPQRGSRVLDLQASAANDIVAILRTEAGRNPYDHGLSDLVGELSMRSDEFRTRWAAHNYASTAPDSKTSITPTRHTCRLLSNLR